MTPSHHDERLARGEPVGPLHGLPMAHKDTHLTAGVRTTSGSPLADHVPVADELLIERLRGAGAITIGKTNVPEFAAGSHTFNPIFGTTRNPYDLGRSAGGSSGAAAALACGMRPLADGSDMGGSLRNPASFCNVVGLRPSPGRVPTHPSGAPWATPRRPVPDGAKGRRRRAAALGDGRPRPGCRTRDRRSPHPWTATSPACASPGPPTSASPSTRPSTHAALDPRLFESLGARVEEACPDLTGADLARAETLRAALFHRVRSFYEQYDVLLAPVSQVPPFDAACEHPTEIGGVRHPHYLDWMASAYLISATGHPAVSVPAGFTPDGLPVGLQIIGPHRGDLMVLQVGHAFETATQVGRRRPDVDSLVPVVEYTLPSRTARGAGPRDAPDHRLLNLAATIWQLPSQGVNPRLATRSDGPVPSLLMVFLCPAPQRP